MNHRASPCLVLLAFLVLSPATFAAEGLIHLGPEEIILANRMEIKVPGYSSPSFEDWNNDGLKDLIVGEGGSGALGMIRVYLNVGTELEPAFGDFFYVQSNGKDLTFTPEGCMGAHPRVVQWDADGRKDLLVGLADGTIRVFLNIASDNEPAFDGGTTVKVGSGGLATLDVGSRATPAFVDWNGDGTLDLVAGGLDGAIHVYENAGGAVPPRFHSSPVGGMLVQERDYNLMVPSARSSPAVFDVDGDGTKDLLTGNTNGQILFYKNMGTNSLPAFAGYTFVQSAGKPIQLGGLRTRPAVCHWTGAKDGYWDLLVGYGDGKIRLYRGLPRPGDFNADGLLDGNDFTILVKALDKPVPPGGSPCDLNGDGAVDLLDLRLFADLWLAEHGEEG